MLLWFDLQEPCQPITTVSTTSTTHLSIIELCCTALPRPSTNSWYYWKRCKLAMWVGLLLDDQVPWQSQITSRESRILRRSEETPSPPNSVSRPGDRWEGGAFLRRMSKTDEEDPKVKPLIFFGGQLNAINTYSRWWKACLLHKIPLSSCSWLLTFRLYLKQSRLGGALRLELRPKWWCSKLQILWWEHMRMA